MQSQIIRMESCDNITTQCLISWAFEINKYMIHNPNQNSSKYMCNRKKIQLYSMCTNTHSDAGKMV